MAEVGGHGKSARLDLSYENYEKKQNGISLCDLQMIRILKLLDRKSIIGVIASQSFYLSVHLLTLCHLSVSPLRWSSLL